MEGHILWYLLGELGILTAIVSMLFRRFEKRLDKREKVKDEKEEARQQYEVLITKMTFASLSVAEATAEAVQRIPDANCNGDMHAALETARVAKEEYRSFEMKQTARSLH